MSTTGFVPFSPPRGRLIGLGGKLRAGKDAVGDYLEEKHDFVKLGMSDALNEALLKLNPLIRLTAYLYSPSSGLEYQNGDIVRYQDLHDAVGYVEAKKNPEVRRLLQVLGTEVGREMIDPDVWVNIAEKKIREHWAKGKSVVITAMRFPNEIEMLNRLGGMSVWIDRPDEGRMAGTEATPGHSMNILEHASETSVNSSMFHYVLTNDGTLDQLYRKVEKRLIGREGMTPYFPEAGLLGFHPPYDR